MHVCVVGVLFWLVFVLCRHKRKREAEAHQQCWFSRRLWKRTWVTKVVCAWDRLTVVMTKGIPA